MLEEQAVSALVEVFLETIMRAQDMEDIVPKKAPMNVFIPPQGKETKPAQNTWTGRDMIYEETQR